MEHTFQQGDMVQHTHSEKLGHIVGIPAVRSGEGFCDVEFGDDTFQCILINLRHDTDFREGDWVRYEATENKQGSSPQRNGEIAQIVRVYEDQSGFEVTDGDMPSYVARANAVKIQPPQEGAMGNIQEDAIERGIKEKIQLLERNLEKAKCILEAYRDLRKFIDQGKGE